MSRTTCSGKPRPQQQQAELLRQQAEALRQQTEALRMESDERARTALTLPAFQSPLPAPETPIPQHGRMWQQLSPTLRNGYVAGYRAGVQIAEGIYDAKGTKEFDVSRYNNGEIAKAIDKFYEGPANILIPMPFAAWMACSRLGGMRADFMEDYLSILRKNFASQPSK